ncbi:hypothetical protein EDC01DRAFT_597816, partial [Geopyxis carbonaria]
VDYDVCRKGCMCFTGTLANLDKCQHCQADRNDAGGNPYKVFTYIPLMHRLRLLYTNQGYIRKM